MTIDTFEVLIIFGDKQNKNNQNSFICPYNIEENNFEYLFEIITMIFPEKKICPCFKYEIQKNNKFSPIEKNRKIKDCINDSKITLKIYKQDKNDCNFKSYYQKSKKEIIDTFFQYINNFNSNHLNLIKEKENYKMKIIKL